MSPFCTQTRGTTILDSYYAHRTQKIMLARKTVALVLAATTLNGVHGLAGHSQFSSTKSLHADAVKPTILNSLSSPHDSSSDTLSRRSLLHLISASTQCLSASILGSQVASAIDFQVPDKSPMNSGASKQRVGGLANKIRNSCKIMVRWCKVLKPRHEIRWILHFNLQLFHSRAICRTSCSAT